METLGVPLVTRAVGARIAQGDSFGTKGTPSPSRVTCSCASSGRIRRPSYSPPFRTTGPRCPGSI